VLAGRWPLLLDQKLEEIQLQDRSKISLLLKESVSEELEGSKGKAQRR